MKILRAVSTIPGEVVSQNEIHPVNSSAASNKVQPVDPNEAAGNSTDGELKQGIRRVLEKIILAKVPATNFNPNDRRQKALAQYQKFFSNLSSIGQNINRAV